MFENPVPEVCVDNRWTQWKTNLLFQYGRFADMRSFDLWNGLNFAIITTYAYMSIKFNVYILRLLYNRSLLILQTLVFGSGNQSYIFRSNHITSPEIHTLKLENSACWLVEIFKALSGRPKHPTTHHQLQSPTVFSGYWHPFRVVLGWAYRGLTSGLLLLRNFSVAISVSPHVCFILVLILISMFLR